MRERNRIENTGTQEKNILKRIPEIDYVKAFCILAMILVHCYEEIYDGDGSAATTLFVDILNVVIGASAFMFCMGFSMDLKSEKSAGDCAKRGLVLLLTGLFLNFLRSPLVRCIHLFTDEPYIVFRGFIDVLAVDILPFAGMAFLVMALLKAMKLKPWGIFIAALLMSAAATPLRYADTGNPAVNAVLGFFIGSNAESTFPVCHWFVFVAAGNVFRTYYVKAEDKKKYYKKVLPVAALISAVFITLAMLEIGPFQCLSEFEYYYWMNPIDALGCIACIITYLGVMWLLSLAVEKLNPGFRPLSYLAANLTRLYFIHWLLLMVIEYVFMEGFELIPWPETDLAILLYTAGFLAVTILINELLRKITGRQKGFFNLTNKFLIGSAVFVAALVILCVGISMKYGLTEVPSFLNEYTVDGITYL